MVSSLLLVFFFVVGVKGRTMDIVLEKLAVLDEGFVKKKKKKDWVSCRKKERKSSRQDSSTQEGGLRSR